MTHDPKVQALIDAASSFFKGPYHRTDEQYVALSRALAAFAPEPEMEYVLPEWENPPKWIEYWMRNCSISRPEYNELRELTRRPYGRD